MWSGGFKGIKAKEINLDWPLILLLWHHICEDNGDDGDYGMEIGICLCVCV